MQRTVGISEMIISTDPAEVLVTYSLGSCVGVTLYDPVAKVGGLIHCMLPLSKINPEKAKACPAMFTDVGITGMLRAVIEKGAQKKRLIAKVAGASQLLDDNGHFKIGERNYIVVRKLFWKNNILIAGESVKGSIARTVYFYMDSGRTMIKSAGEEFEI